MMDGSSSSVLVDVRHLEKHFPIGSGLFGGSRTSLRAINDVSFEIHRGEVLGLVGESGSGKSTIGRTLVGLTSATSGEIWFDGTDLATLSERELHAYRSQIQMVFQDPFSSLNPRMTVAQSLTMPLRFNTPELTQSKRMEMAAKVMDLVGLSNSYLERYPHEFSGGQRQRIGIARALILNPQFIVADEAVSALDVSVQAQVLNLFKQVRRDMNVTMLFIAHDLAVVGNISDRIAVIYLGKLVELAPTRALFTDPKHPYTEALMSAAPEPVPNKESKRILLKGDIPSPIDPPSGCVFRTRCRFATAECSAKTPQLRQVASGHHVACHRDDIELRAIAAQDARDQPQH